MKLRAILAILLFLLLTTIASADVTFGLRSIYGFTDTEQAGEKLGLDYLVDRFRPGFIIGFDNGNWGMTFDFGFAFTPGAALVPNIDESWWMNFDYSAALDLHLFPGTRVLDPYVGINAGFGLEADITDYEEAGYPEDYSPAGEEGLTSLAFQGGVHAGLQLKLGGFFVNTRIAATLLDVPIPGMAVDLHERSPFTLMLGAGLRL